MYTDTWVMIKSLKSMQHNQSDFPEMKDWIVKVYNLLYLE